MAERIVQKRTDPEGHRRRPRALEHWIAFSTGRPADDGWTPTPRYRLVVTVLLILTGVAVLRGTWADRGALAAAAFGAFWLFCMSTVLRGGAARSRDFFVRHPYLDAAFSIPIAAMLVLVLLPKDWPTAVLLAIGVSYVALIFGGALRGDRRRKACRAERAQAAGRAP